MDPTPVTAWFALAGAVLAVASPLILSVMWLNRKREARLKELILQVTQPIQSGFRNGGNSNTDQSVMLKALLASQETMHADFVRHLEHHLEGTST